MKKITMVISAVLTILSFTTQADVGVGEEIITKNDIFFDVGNSGRAWRGPKSRSYYLPDRGDGISPGTFVEQTTCTFKVLDESIEALKLRRFVRANVVLTVLDISVVSGKITIKLESPLKNHFEIDCAVTKTITYHDINTGDNRNEDVRLVIDFSDAEKVLSQYLTLPKLDSSNKNIKEL